MGNVKCLPCPVGKNDPIGVKCVATSSRLRPDPFFFPTDSASILLNNWMKLQKVAVSNINMKSLTLFTKATFCQTSCPFTLINTSPVETMF